MKRLIGLSFAGVFTCYMGYAQTTEPTKKDQQDQTDTKVKIEQYDATKQTSDAKGREKISESDLPEKVKEGFEKSEYSAYTITEVYKLTGEAAQLIPKRSTQPTDMNENMDQNKDMDHNQNKDMDHNQNMESDTTGMQNESATSDSDTYANKNWQNSDNMEADSTAMENNTKTGNINDRSREGATTDTYANKNWQNSDNMEADSTAMENNTELNENNQDNDTSETYANKNRENADNMQADSMAMENNTELNENNQDNATSETYANKNRENADNMQTDTTAMENGSNIDNMNGDTMTEYEKGSTQANTNMDDISGMENRVFYELHVANTTDNAVLFFSEEGEIYDTSVGGSTGE